MSAYDKCAIENRNEDQLPSTALMGSVWSLCIATNAVRWTHHNQMNSFKLADYADVTELGSGRRSHPATCTYAPSGAQLPISHICNSSTVHAPRFDLLPTTWGNAAKEKGMRPAARR
jgi:hypothetical protein